VSGGAVTGIAPAGFPSNHCGLSYSLTGESQSSAINGLDHHWLQTTNAPIVIDMGAPVNTAIVFPSEVHGGSAGQRVAAGGRWRMENAAQVRGLAAESTGAPGPGARRASASWTRASARAGSARKSGCA
jgi:hypothetical protein